LFFFKKRIFRETIQHERGHIRKVVSEKLWLVFLGDFAVAGGEKKKILLPREVEKAEEGESHAFFLYCRRKNRGEGKDIWGRFGRRLAKGEKRRKDASSEKKVKSELKKKGKIT